MIAPKMTAKKIMSGGGAMNMGLLALGSWLLGESSPQHFFQSIIGFNAAKFKRDGPFQSQEPRAKSQEPRAKSQEPRAKSQQR
jgi:hypothetical protein